MVKGLSPTKILNYTVPAGMRMYSYMHQLQAISKVGERALLHFSSYDTSVQYSKGFHRLSSSFSSSAYISPWKMISSRREF